MIKTGSNRTSSMMRRPALRKTCLSTAVALACAPIAIHAEQWKYNAEVFLSGGDKRSLLGARALIPFRQDADSMWYGDIRGTLSDHSTDEINLGGGYRQFTKSGEWILGGYLAYDSRNSRSDTRWEQIALGAEALSDTWDFRGNIYAKLDDEEVISSIPGVTSSTMSSGFAGFNIVQTTVSSSTAGSNIYEESMSGYDLEFGRLLPISDKHEVRAYLGAYHYDGDIVKDADGVRARVEWRPRKNITVSLAAQDDNLFGSLTSLQVAWSFGYPNKRGIRTLRERMTQFVHRDVDIIETSSLPARDRTEIDPTGPATSGSTTTQVVAVSNIVHVDDTAADGGDGTIENPFNDFGECRVASGTQGCGTGKSTQYVYVHTGDTVTGTALDTSDDGISGPGTSTFDLQPNVSLIGEGTAFFIVSAGTAPELTASGGNDVVNLLGNNEVAGLVINNDSGSAGNGITFAPTTGTHEFNIHSNTFDLSGAGEAINGTTTGDAITNVIIANNAFNNSAGGSNDAGGIRIENGSSGTQAVTVTGNTLNDLYDGGIVVQNGNYGSTAGAQTVVITGNTINNSYGTGIDVAASYTGTEQTATITGNTINNHDGTGIDVSAYYGGTQTATISNNTISGTGSGGYGINLTASPNVTQTATIASNTISGMDEGIQIQGNAGYGTTTTQTVNITGNTLTGNGGLGYGAYTTSNAGIGVQGSSSSSSYYGNGTLTQTVNITGNNVISDFTTGIGIQGGSNYGGSYYPTGDMAQTVTVDGATLTNNDYGINIVNQSDNKNIDSYYSGYGQVGGTATQTVTVSNSTITGNTVGVNIENIADAGIYYHGYGGANTNSGLATQTVNLTNNTITGNEFGVIIDNQANADYDYGESVAGTANQTVNLTGNIITGNDYGVRIDNNAIGDSVYATPTSTQTINLTGNTISNNNYAGLDIDNISNKYGTATQTINLTSNNISNNGLSGYGSGITANNNTTKYATATQDINMTSNTIQNNNGYGLSGYNSADKYATANQTIDMTVGGGGNIITGHSASYDDVYASNYESFGGTAAQIVDMGSSINTIGTVSNTNSGSTQTITGP